MSNGGWEEIINLLILLNADKELINKIKKHYEGNNKETIETKILKYLQGKIYWLEDEIKRLEKVCEVSTLEEDKLMWCKSIKEYKEEMDLLMVIHRIVHRYFLVEEECFGTTQQSA
jgi:hypothetical protein